METETVSRSKLRCLRRERISRCRQRGPARVRALKTQAETGMPNHVEIESIEPKTHSDFENRPPVLVSRGASEDPRATSAPPGRRDRKPSCRRQPARTKATASVPPGSQRRAEPR